MICSNNSAFLLPLYHQKHFVYEPERAKWQIALICNGNIMKNIDFFIAISYNVMRKNEVINIARQ